MKRRRYHTLDGLRGVGALFVVLYHFAPDFGIPAPAHGYLAVDLFFCLSGFVLTRGYAEKLSDGMPFQQWMSVRLRRLYPLFFLSIAIGFALTAIPGFPGSELPASGRIMALGFNLFMLPAPTAMKATFPLNFVAWSLFVEMLLSVQFFWTAKLRSRSILVLTVAGLASLFALRVAVGYVSGGYSWHDLPMGVARGLFSFSVGMLIARKTGGHHVTSSAAWLPLAAAALILAVNPPHGTAYDLLMIVAGFPLLVLASVHVEPVNPSAFSTAGELSYPCYALHWSFTFAFLSFFGFNAHHPAPAMIGLILLAIFLYGCRLLDRYYDTPLRKAPRAALARSSKAA
jgi:peptidoglycan/LPS O-acetylase OafA/YrhL